MNFGDSTQHQFYTDLSVAVIAGASLLLASLLLPLRG